MMDQYFVQVETFAPKNNKCRALIKWVETFNNAIFVPGIIVDGGAFSAFKQIVKNHCEALDKEYPGTAPFKVDTADRIVVKRVETLFEVNRDVHLDTAFYQYIIHGI